MIERCPRSICVKNQKESFELLNLSGFLRTLIELPVFCLFMQFLLLEIGGFLFAHSVFLHTTYSDYIPYFSVCWYPVWNCAFSIFHRSAVWCMVSVSAPTDMCKLLRSHILNPQSNLGNEISLFLYCLQKRDQCPNDYSSILQQSL